ncbi:hypothetical protein HDU87_003971 [Geranomyces variabilis]|uniref:Uncharacterized protein n=1 Tax=Geranomyces variabilis TaxID=109894 RepID=A0AAD5TQX9_9FUNG|nr:hypothetical protein HDU87_003971 [Geranomyces variabilis]
MQACGLLCSSILHNQLGPSARYLNKAVTPAQLLLHTEPDVRKMFSLPPVIVPADSASSAMNVDINPSAPEPDGIFSTSEMDVDGNQHVPELASILSTIRMDLDTIPPGSAPLPSAGSESHSSLMYADNNQPASSLIEKDTFACLAKLNIGRPANVNQSRYITQVLCNHLGTALTSEIVDDAKAAFDPYAALLKVFMRGYQTVVNRLFNKRGSILRNQAGCLITEAVPYMKAKALPKTSKSGKKAQSLLETADSSLGNANALSEDAELLPDWRPFVFVAGCNSKSKKVVYIREYLVLCQFKSADSNKLTGKFAFLFSCTKTRGTLIPPKRAVPEHFTACVNEVLKENLVMMCCQSGRVYTGLRWKNKQTAEASLQSLQKLDAILGAIDLGPCLSGIRMFDLDVTRAVCPWGKRAPATAPPKQHAVDAFERQYLLPASVNVKPEQPSPARLAAASLEIAYPYHNLTPPQKLCVFALTSQCRGGYFERVPKYNSIDTSKRKQGRKSTPRDRELCIQVDLPKSMVQEKSMGKEKDKDHGAEHEKTIRELLFGISASANAGLGNAELGVTYTLVAFHPDGKKSPMEAVKTDLERYQERTRKQLNDKRNNAEHAVPHHISAEEVFWQSPKSRD